MQEPESSKMQVYHQMVNTSFTIQKQVPVVSNSDLVPLIKIATLEHVYPTIRKLFTKSIPNVPLLANFITVWGKITFDQENLSIVKRHEIKFASPQFKEKTLMLTKMSKNISLLEQNVLEVLEKGTILKVVPTQGQFLSNLFLVEKRDGVNHPVINLKNLNKFIPCEHFKMECLHCPSITGQLAMQDEFQGVRFQFQGVRFQWLGHLDLFFAFVLELSQL